MAASSSEAGITQTIFPMNPKAIEILRENIHKTHKIGVIQKLPAMKGFNVTIKMATGGKSGRQGSAEKPYVIPHTRIDDESHMSQYYEIGRKLGEGTFGIVKEVVHKETGKTWACKAVNKEKAGSPVIKLLEREVAILKRVHHDHIIRLKEIFETSKKMYLIIEYCDRGELADVLKDKGTFPEKDVKVIMERLAKAIAYLHKNDMVHRDIKLENILLSKNPEDKSDDLYIKVTDFGLSVVKSGVGIENLLMDFCGTPMYMAPEIIDNKTYGEKCDVWAMGVIAFVLLTGMPPFRSRDEDKLYEIIKTADIKDTLYSDPACKDFSKEAKDCIEKMLIVDPAHRFTASEIADHPWVTGEDLQTMRPGNVLDMMRKWRTDPNFASSHSDEQDDMDGAINGEDSLLNVNRSPQRVKSESSSRSSSASSGRKDDQSKSLTNVAGTSKSKKLSSQTGTTQKGTKPPRSPNISQATKASTNKTSNGLSRVSSDTNTRGKKKR